MNEIFVDIVGYEGLYQISNWGRVKSFPRHGTNVGFLKPRRKKNGYLEVVLHKNGIGKPFKVHRLVAEAFIPNDDLFKTQINHKNENKELNFVWVNDNGSIDESKSNLEWVTSKENCNRGTRTERQRKKMINHPKMSKKILQFDKQGNFIKEWVSTQEVERQIGIDHRHISDCCNGKRKTHKGYIWKYKNDE